MNKKITPIQNILKEAIKNGYGLLLEGD